MTAPRNVPQPDLPVPAGGFVAGQVGPETIQLGTERSRRGFTMYADAVGQGRSPLATYQDRKSPQGLRARTDIVDLADPNVVALQSAAEHLPGRLRPHGTDGEPSWQNAIGAGGTS